MLYNIGAQIGNYTLVRHLGHGGFADVYLGQHIHLNRPAALKLLHTQLGENDIKAFQHEAQIIANLSHSNIIHILEFGIEKGMPFLVMEYAPAGNLRTRHPHGTRLSPATCADYAKQIASALHLAHQHKIIHRDVKPENMLISPSGKIKLSDFGIATALLTSRSQSKRDIIGTVVYMAPEQLQGKPTFASDQYALAIVLYEWLTGQTPFQGTFTEVATQHVLVAPAPLRTLVPSLPVPVEQVILKALAKDPTQRFSNIQAFTTAFEQAVQGHSLSLDMSTILANLTPTNPPSTIPPTVIASTVNTPTAERTAPTQTGTYPTTIRNTIPHTQTPNTHTHVTPGSFASHNYPATPTKKSPSHILYISTITVLLLLVVGMGVFTFLRLPNMPNQSAINFFFTNTGEQSTSQQTKSTPQTTKTIPTPTTEPTPTPSPTPAPVLASDQLIKIDKRLNCPKCITPLIFTLKSIKIENDKRRMIWSLEVYNSGNRVISVDIRETLLKNLSGESIRGAGSSGTISLSVDGSAEFTIYYAYIPYKNVEYTFTLAFYDYYNRDFKNDPFTVTF